DRRVDERIPPEQVADRGGTVSEFLQGLVRDEGNAAIGRGDERVIHRRRVQALQIRDITGEVERQNLAAAVQKHLLPVHIAFEQQAAGRSAAALADDFIAAAGSGFEQRETFKLRNRLFAELADTIELAPQRVGQVHWMLEWEMGVS